MALVIFYAVGLVSMIQLPPGPGPAAETPDIDRRVGALDRLLIQDCQLHLGSRHSPVCGSGVADPLEIQVSGFRGLSEPFSRVAGRSTDDVNDQEDDEEPEQNVNRREDDMESEKGDQPGNEKQQRKCQPHGKPLSRERR
jgi:hypothetical protein